MTEDASSDGLAAALGFSAELATLQQVLAAWVADTDSEICEALAWQFQGGSKFFRPIATFSAYRAVYEGPIPPALIRSAAVLEMLHNVTLIIDDILDRSPLRRGRATLHCQVGMLPALMASGYLVAEGYRLVKDDAHDVQLLSELLKRLGVAECLQWRLRRQPLGVEDWRRIAGEDTGSMFEVCACLGTRTDELRRFGHLLGVLYHGCDDVGDVRGGAALGGGGTEDVRDGILTLPAALAIRRPETADLFRRADPSPADLEAMALAFRACVPEADRYLDALADDARTEARGAANPGPLLALVDRVRRLSNQ